MGVFTFVLNKSGAEWSAKQYSGDIEASGDSAFEIQRNLVKAVLAVDSSGGVQSSYSPVSPSSGVFLVHLSTFIITVFSFQIIYFFIFIMLYRFYDIRICMQRN
jgi:large-conductance mechanosensitive channel